MIEDKQTFGLKSKMNKASAIRSMCQTPGFQILKKEFEAKIEKVTIKILDLATSPEEVASLRQKVQVWIEIQKMLKTMMLTGELCKRALDNVESFNETSPEVMDKEKQNG